MSINNNRSFTVTGFTVWGICALFFLYEFLLRTIIGTFQHPIMYDLNLSPLKFSLLSTSTYLLIYGIMQIPVGLITDYYGLKKTLFTGAMICSLSAIGFAYSHNFSTALFFRILTGLGSSFGFICLLISVYECMPKRNTAFLIGISQFIGTIGPMIAAGPINSLTENSSINWRNIFLFLGLIGLSLALLIIIFVKSNPQKEGNYLILRKPEKLTTSIKQLFLRLSPWSIALFSASIYFSIEFLSENDGKIFLTLKEHSPKFSSYMITISWLGYAIGCPLLGFLSDYFERRKNIMLVSAIIGIASITTIVFSNEKSALINAFFLLGIAGSGQSVGFAMMAEHFKSKHVAIGLSLNNAAITILSAINAPIISFILDSIKTTEQPSLANYQSAFYALIILACLALILVIFSIKETFCKSAVDFTYLNVRRKPR